MKYKKVDPFEDQFGSLQSIIFGDIGLYKNEKNQISQDIISLVNEEIWSKIANDADEKINEVFGLE